MDACACACRAVRTLRRIRDVLEEQHPNDVLMPVRRGEKCPMFPHRGGCWSWKSFDEFAGEGKRPPPHDVCVLLSDLCVVDVDDIDTARKLEERFPVLREVPREVTRRGMHYWFVRSDEADRDGYYDGPGQRMSGVDFKTRCSNGTRGVIVIAPSSGKRWDVPLATDLLRVIPSDLLDAVAVPKHRALTGTFRYACGAVTPDSTSRFAGGFDYFEPFIEGDLGGDIPIPVTRTAFDRLMALVEHGELTDYDVRPEGFAEVLRAADMLGMKNAAHKRRLMTGVPFSQLDMNAVAPDVWHALHDEKRWKRAGAVDDGSVLADVAPLTPILYEPLALPANDERWLFHRRSNMKRSHAPGDPVVPAIAGIDGMQALFERRLPPPVLALMREHPLVLAGGAVLGILAPKLGKGADYDLFMVLDDESAASAIIDKIRSELPEGVRTLQTPWAFTMIGDDDKGEQLVVQIVMRLHANPGLVVTGFDTHPSKVAAWFDRDTGRLVVRATPTWAPAMRRCALVVDLTAWGRATIARIFKYHVKGFDVLVPGLRRNVLASVVPPPPPAIKHSSGSGSGSGKIRRLLPASMMRIRRRNYGTGFGALLNAEEVLAARTPGGRLTQSDVYWVVRNITKSDSDYSMIAKLSNRVFYITRTVLNAGLTWLSTAGPVDYILRAMRLRRPQPPPIQPPLQWHRCDPRAKCMAMFQPEDPRIKAAYNPALLDAVVATELGLDDRG